jgi:predicted nucleic acid-binding protein
VPLTLRVQLPVGEVLPVDGEAMRLATDLAERYPNHALRDLVHVATMQRHGITTILSVDSDFDAIAEVVRAKPSP